MKVLAFVFAIFLLSSCNAPPDTSVQSFASTDAKTLFSPWISDTRTLDLSSARFNDLSDSQSKPIEISLLVCTQSHVRAIDGVTICDATGYQVIPGNCYQALTLNGDGYGGTFDVSTPSIGASCAGKPNGCSAAMSAACGLDPIYPAGSYVYRIADNRLEICSGSCEEFY